MPLRCVLGAFYALHCAAGAAAQTATVLTYPVEMTCEGAQQSLGKLAIVHAGFLLVEHASSAPLISPQPITALCLASWTPGGARSGAFCKYSTSNAGHFRDDLDEWSPLQRPVNWFDNAVSVKLANAECVSSEEGAVQRLAAAFDSASASWRPYQVRAALSGLARGDRDAPYFSEHQWDLTPRRGSLSWNELTEGIHRSWTETEFDRSPVATLEVLEEDVEAFEQVVQAFIASNQPLSDSMVEAGSALVERAGAVEEVQWLFPDLDDQASALRTRVEAALRLGGPTRPVVFPWWVLFGLIALVTLQLASAVGTFVTVRKLKLVSEGMQPLGGLESKLRKVVETETKSALTKVKWEIAAAQPRGDTGDLDQSAGTWDEITAKIQTMVIQVQSLRQLSERAENQLTEAEQALSKSTGNAQPWPGQPLSERIRSLVEYSNRLYRVVTEALDAMALPHRLDRDDALSGSIGKLVSQNKALATSSNEAQRSLDRERQRLANAESVTRDYLGIKAGPGGEEHQPLFEVLRRELDIEGVRDARMAMRATLKPLERVMADVRSDRPDVARLFELPELERQLTDLQMYLSAPLLSDTRGLWIRGLRSPQQLLFQLLRIEGLVARYFRSSGTTLPALSRAASQLAAPLFRSLEEAGGEIDPMWPLDAIGSLARGDAHLQTAMPLHKQIGEISTRVREHRQTTNDFVIDVLAPRYRQPGSDVWSKPNLYVYNPSDWTL